jgi:hypothetical protein
MEHDDATVVKMADQVMFEARWGLINPIAGQLRPQDTTEVQLAQHTRRQGIEMAEGWAKQALMSYAILRENGHGMRDAGALPWTRVPPEGLVGVAVNGNAVPGRGAVADENLVPGAGRSAQEHGDWDLQIAQGGEQSGSALRVGTVVKGQGDLSVTGRKAPRPLRKDSLTQAHDVL